MAKIFIYKLLLYGNTVSRPQYYLFDYKLSKDDEKEVIDEALSDSCNSVYRGTLEEVEAKNLPEKDINDIISSYYCKLQYIESSRKWYTSIIDYFHAIKTCKKKYRIVQDHKYYPCKVGYLKFINGDTAVLNISEVDAFETLVEVSLSNLIEIIEKE